MSVSMRFFFAAALLGIFTAYGAVIQPDGVEPVPAPFGPGITTITDPSTIITIAEPTNAALGSDILTILEPSSTITPALPISGMFSVADGGVPPATPPPFVSAVIPVLENGTVVESTQSPDALQSTSVPNTPSFSMGINFSEATTSIGLSPESSSVSAWPTFSIPPNLTSALSATSLQTQAASLPTSVVYTTISVYQPLLPSSTQSPSNITLSQLSMATCNLPLVTTPSTTTTITSNLTTTLYTQTTVIVTTNAPVPTPSISYTGIWTCLSGGPQVAGPPILPARRQVSNATTLSTDLPELGDPCNSVFTTTVYVTPTMTDTWITITVTGPALNDSLSTLPALISTPTAAAITSYVTISATSTVPVPMNASSTPSFSSIITTTYSTNSQPQTTMPVSTPTPTIDPTTFNFSSMVASYASSSLPAVTVALSTTSVLAASSTVLGLSSSSITSAPLQASVFSPAPTLASMTLNFSSMVASDRTQGANSSSITVSTSPPSGFALSSPILSSSTKGDKPSSTSIFKNPAPSHPGFASIVSTGKIVGPKKSSTSSHKSPASSHRPSPSLDAEPGSTSTHKDTTLSKHAPTPLGTTKIAESSTTISLKNPLASHAAVLVVSEQHSTPVATATDEGGSSPGMYGRSDGRQIGSWITKVSKLFLPFGKPTPTTLLTVPRTTTSATAVTAGAASRA